MELIIAIFVAYVIGSVPTVVWAGKLFAGIDVREHGGGNAGVTNTLRVILIDIVKGLLATRLVYLNFFDTQFILSNTVETKLILGIAAVFGHILPLFANFRGGKGIATFFGVIIGIHTQSALLSLVVFILIVNLTQFWEQ